MHFDIADMQLFMRVASAGSLTQGAREGARSPSAASTRLRSLESQLGARLFYREPNGLTLTSAGQEFLAHAERILAEYEMARRVFQSKSYSSSGHLRVMANSASFSEIIPDVILQLLDSDPGITIDVQQKNSRQSIRGIMENEADIAFVTGEDDYGDLNSILFAVDYFSIVAPEGHPVLSAETINIAEAVKYPMLTTYGTTLFHYLNEKIEKAGFRARYRILLNSFESIIRLVEGNAGIAIIPESVAIGFSKKYRFGYVRVQEDWTLRNRRLIFGSTDFLSPPAVAFIRVIVEKYLKLDFSACAIEDILEKNRGKRA